MPNPERNVWILGLYGPKSPGEGGEGQFEGVENPGRRLSHGQGKFFDGLTMS
jgi:hypothetical protein